MNKLRIRQEEPADYDKVRQLVELAFKEVAYSDHTEHYLVERLRKSSAFVPELSMVAEFGHIVAGYILLTQIWVVKHSARNPSLALAPMAVLPCYQKMGIDGRLIEAVQDKAKDLGYTSVIVQGHADYYPRFVYKKASAFGIKLPFDVPDENCMAIELSDQALKESNGMVEYANEFYSLSASI